MAGVRRTVGENFPERNYSVEAGGTKEIGNRGLACQSVHHKGHYGSPRKTLPFPEDFGLVGPLFAGGRGKPRF
jgi:hypothetical protein